MKGRQIHALQKSHHSDWFSRSRRRNPLDAEWYRLRALLPRHERERKEKGSSEYKTRTEWHRVISWNKLAEWAGALQKGAYIEVEGELRYREYTPAESDRSLRWLKSMPSPSWRWTTRTDSPFLFLYQSQPTSLSTDPVSRATNFMICCPAFAPIVTVCSNRRGPPLDEARLEISQRVPQGLTNFE